MAKNKYILYYKKDDGKLIHLLESEDLYILAYFLILCKTDSSFIAHFHLCSITNFLLCHESSFYQDSDLLDSSLIRKYYDIDYDDPCTEKIIQLLYDYDNPKEISSINLYNWLRNKSIEDLDCLLKISISNSFYNVLPSQHRDKSDKILKKTLLF